MQGVPTPLAVIGLGSVGRRLAQRWQHAGLAVHGYSRTSFSRERAAALGLCVEPELAGALARASTLVLCVNDTELSKVAAEIASALAAKPHEGEPLVCLHTSGAGDHGALELLVPLRCEIGMLHPLAAFEPDGPGPRLEDAWCAVAGTAKLRSNRIAVILEIILGGSEKRVVNCVIFNLLVRIN